jgi:hypothetical protein
VAEGQGPFDQYLNQPYQPSRTPLSGLGGNTEGILNFANEFLRGVSQGRMQKMAQQEQQRARHIDALTTIAKFAQSTGLPPQVLEGWNTNVTRLLAEQVAGADDGAKGKEKGGGNPLFSFAKQFAGNLIGMGDGGTKKAKPIDESTIGTLVSDLTNTISQHRQTQQDVGQRLSKAYMDIKAKNGGWVSQEDLSGSPEFMSAYNDAQNNGVDVSKQMNVLMAGTLNPAQTQQRRDETEYMKMFGGGQSQPVQAQPANPPTPPQAPVVAMAPQPATPQAPNLGDAVNSTGYLAQAQRPISDVPEPPLIASNGSIPAGAIPRQPSVPPAQQFATASGQQQMPSMLGDVFPMTPAIQRTFAARGVRPTEEYLYAGPGKYHLVQNYGVQPDGKPLIIDRDSGRRVNMDAARQAGFQSVNTLTNEMRGQTGDQMKGAREAIATRIGTASILSPEDRKAAEAIAAGQFASGDFKGATDAVERFIADRERAAERKQAEDQRRGDRQERLALTQGVQKQGLAFKYTTAIENTVPLKNYDTVAQYADMMEQAAAQARTNDNKAKGIADLNLIRGAAKITDPPSTVREGEQQTYTAAQGLLNKWKAKVEGGWMNGAVLDDSARAEFLKMAREIRAIQRKYAADAVGPRLRQAKGQGIEYQEILRESMWDIGDQVFGNKSKDPPKPAGANPAWNPGGANPRGF